MKGYNTQYSRNVLDFTEKKFYGKEVEKGSGELE